MKQTKRIVVMLLCLLVAMSTIFALTSCGGNDECEHSNTEWVVVKEATETETGTKNQVCLDCTAIVSTETIPATGTADVPTPPATPEGLARNGAIISWGAVEGATGYVVKIGEDTYEVTAPSLDLTTLTLTAGTTYEISVQAVNADGSSAFCEAVSFGYLVGEFEISYANKVVSWEPVEFATSYEVRVNGGEIVTLGNLTTYNVTLTQAGENVIEVRYTDGGNTEWMTLTVTAYTVTYDSLSLSGGEVYEYLATGDAMTLPTGTYTNTGYEFSGWFSAVEGGNQFQTGDIFTANNDLTVYGGWTALVFDLNLKVEGVGITNIQDGATQGVTYDSAFTLPVPTPTDEGTGMFLGWYTGQTSLSNRVTDEYGKSVGVAKFTEATNVYPVFIQNVLSFNLKSDDTYEVTAGPNFDRIANVTIPATYQGKPVTSILENAFDSRKLLVSINIPNSIELVGAGAFYGNTNLEAINVYEVEGNHEVLYYSHEGALVRNDMGTITLEVFPRAKTGSFTTPEGVTTIPSKVFQYSSISEIVISKDVAAIYERAFYSCQKLTSVVFEGGREYDVTLMCGTTDKPDSIFYATTNITSITFPAKLAEFNYTYVLNQLTKLNTINVEEGGQVYSSVDGMLANGVQDTIYYAPLSVTGDFVIPTGIVNIGANAFKGRTGITSVTVPFFVQTIGDNAFSGCTKVSSVTFEGGRFFDLTIGKSAFASCDIKNITFGGTGNDTFIDEGGIIIGDSAFIPGTSATLKTVTFGKGSNVKSIGANAFKGQSKLETVTFEDNAIVATIGASAFANTGIKKLNIPASVTGIGASAFSGCASLTSVTFNEGSSGNITFGSSAFANCAKITEVHLPSTVSQFDGTVFNGCTALTKIAVADTNPYLESDNNGVLYNEEMSTLIYYPRGLAVDKATLDALPWATEDNTITTIGAAAFSGHPSLASFEIKKGITNIGEGAFQNCTALTTLTYESGAAAGATLTISKNAFSGCTKLTSASIPSYTTVIGEAAFKSTKFSSFTMPTELTTIGVDAFTSNTALTAITIPAKVTSVGAGAFQSCTKLATVNVEASDTMFSFKNSGSKGAFKGCTSLTTIDLKNRVTVIGDYTFAGAGLTSFTIGSNVTTIGAKAFQATKITSLNVPNNVTSIGLGAFSGMTNLSSITFDEGDKALTFGSKVFVNDSALTSITFPARTTKLDGEVLGGTVASLIKVSDIADFFAGCTSLKNVNVTAGASNKYVSINGVLYRAQAGVPTALLYCPALNEGTLIDGVATIVVPKTVTLVENRSLLNLEKIKTIKFEEYAETDAKYGKPSLAFGRGTSAEDALGNTDYAVIGKTPIYKVDNDGNQTKSNNKTVIIKDGFNSVTTLSLPSHLSSFGPYSVSTTKDTLTLDINPDASAVTIGKYAFSGARIVEYNFPGVKQLAQWAFTGAFSQQSNNASTYSMTVVTGGFTSTELSTLPFTFVFGSKSTLTNIPVQSFNGAKFEHLIVPKSVVTIDQAFYNANRLKTLSFEEGSELTTIGGSAFGLCTSLTSVDFTNATKLTTFGNNVFQNCTFTSFTFPENIQALGSVFFNGCANLTSVTLNKDFTPEMFYSHDGSNYTTCIFGSKDTYAAKNLQAIYVHPENPYFESVDGILYSEDMSIIYCFPAGKDPAGYTIPSTVTQISHFAFEGFRGTSLTLPAGLTYIGDNAFEDTKLTSITIPQGVEYVGNYAFRAKSSSGTAATNHLTTVNFVKGNTKMTTIGEYAFTGQTKITAINNIPDSVNKIGQYAFNGLQSLKTIVLPASITEISKGMLQNCYALESVTIQENVLSIGMNAFSNAYALTTVTLPSGLTTIGETAFQASGIVSVVCPDDSKLATIGARAFLNCTNLTSINLPATFTELPVYVGSTAGGQVSNYTYSEAFKGCTSLKYIDISGVDAIHDSTFEGCTSLETVVVSDTLESIGKKAFYGTPITEIALPATLTKIGTSAFENCTKLTTVTFDPANSMTELGTSLTAADNIFKNTTSLESITLPTSLEMIGGHVFENSGIASVNLGKLTELTEIGNYAFANCDNLEAVVVPTEVYHVGDYAFYDCDNIANPTLYFSIEYFGALAFGSCDKITDGYIPASVTTLNGNPYAACAGVSSLRVDPDNIELVVDANGSIYDEDKTTIYYYSITAGAVPTLPSTVTTIAAGAFSGSDITSFNYASKYKSVAPFAFANCAKLTTVTLAEGLTAIGDHAFDGCVKLNNVTIPASATIASGSLQRGAFGATIGNYAFANCTALSNVTYASTTNTYIIGTHVFENCTSITSVKLPTKFYISDEQAIALNRGTTFVSVNATTGAVTVRQAAMGQILPAYMFAGTGIVNAVIPSNIVYLEGEGVFANCQELETVTFQASSLKYLYLGNYMFYNCDSLTDIEIPVSTMANAHPLASPVGYVFAECDNLETVTLYYRSTANVTFTGKGMFMNCKSLKDLILYDVTSPYTGNGGNNSGSGDSEEGGSTGTLTPSTPGTSTPGFGTPDDEEAGGSTGTLTPSTPGTSTPGFGTPDGEEAGGSTGTLTPSTPGTSTPGFGTSDGENAGSGSGTTTPGFGTSDGENAGSGSGTTTPGFGTSDGENAGSGSGTTTPGFNFEVAPVGGFSIANGVTGLNPVVGATSIVLNNNVSTFGLGLSTSGGFVAAGGSEDAEETTGSTGTISGIGTAEDAEETTGTISTPTFGTSDGENAGTTTTPTFGTADDAEEGGSTGTLTPSTPSTPGFGTADDAEEGGSTGTLTPSTPGTSTPGFGTPDDEEEGGSTGTLTPSTPGTSTPGTSTPGFGTPDDEEEGGSTGTLTPSTPGTSTPGFGTPDDEEEGGSTGTLTPSTPGTSTPGFGTPEDEEGGSTGGTDTDTPAYNEGYLGYIGESWFEGCESLEEITIMNNAYIGDSAFEGCTSLETVNFYDPNGGNDDSTGGAGSGDSEGSGSTGTLTPSTPGTSTPGTGTLTPSTPGTSTPGFGTDDGENAGSGSGTTTPGFGTSDGENAGSGSGTTTPGFGTSDGENAGSGSGTTPGFNFEVAPTGGISIPTYGPAVSTLGFGTSTGGGFGTSDGENAGGSTTTTPGFGTPDDEEAGGSTGTLTPSTPGTGTLTPSTPSTPGFGTPEDEEAGDSTGGSDAGYTGPTLKYLGNNAFKGCTAITSIDLPGIPANAGTGVFEGWTAEQTINLSNTEAELADQADDLFAGCEATVNYATEEA